MTEVYIAAGSNIRPRTHLRRALAALGESWPGLRVSRAFANRAVGFEGEDFINLAACYSTDEPPARVLARLREIERACGRPREAPKWAARTLDLDLLLYGDEVGRHDGAELPRPDLVTRAYMLGPLADLAPGLRHPVLGLTIGEIWQRFDRDAHPLVPVSLEGED